MEMFELRGFPNIWWTRNRFDPVSYTEDPKWIQVWPGCRGHRTYMVSRNWLVQDQKELQREKGIDTKRTETLVSHTSTERLINCSVVHSPLPHTTHTCVRNSYLLCLSPGLILRMLNTRTCFIYHKRFKV